MKFIFIYIYMCAFVYLNISGNRLFNLEGKINVTAYIRTHQFLKFLFSSLSRLYIPKKMASAHPNQKNGIYAHKTNTFHNKNNSP